MAVVKKAEELGEEAVSQVEKRRRRKEGFERAGNDAPTVPLDALPFSTRPSSTHHPLPHSNVLLPDRKFRPESDLARKRQG